MKQGWGDAAVASREARGRLNFLEELIRHESELQNLVSASTFDTFRDRHIIDSLQLAPEIAEGLVVDIGSGAGLPGLVLAIVLEGRFVLVEPRRKRAEFLERAVERLDLGSRVEVRACRVESLSSVHASSIAARAVARLEALFEMASHLATPETRWVLPKGRSAAEELARARQSWHGEFRLVPSLTDPDAAIVIAEGVRRRTT